jgi:hypothetical protein
MAPARPAATSGNVTTCGSTPFAILPATCVPKTRNAMKLKNAAQTTAARGLSTRVETTVAIELAASWNPLMKSKQSASPTSKTSVSMRSYAYSRTMPSTILATSSHRSVASSMLSRMSRHFRTKSGSLPALNKFAISRL